VTLLAIDGLEVAIGGRPILKGIGLRVAAGEALGIVGESGSGKSMTALAIMRLLPAGARAKGAIRIEGADLLLESERAMEARRGRDIGLIFQEPMTALNPVYPVGEQIAESVRLHQKKSRAEARALAIDMLRLVGIPAPEERVDNYPHELSGGMRQRVMIAMAMSCNPEVLIADEPTTALDVTIQAQILELIRKLQQERGMSVLLITHDLGVVAENAHEVAVMYAGKVVEYAPVEALFATPRHPYTIGLLRSLPELAAPGQRLATIPGIVPPATRFPSGCRFRTRCSLAQARCAEVEPVLEPLAGQPEHRVACHFLEAASRL
jgi:oligopeptide/dipeptide ABC transporter ATP-binding protein